MAVNIHGVTFDDDVAPHIAWDTRTLGAGTKPSTSDVDLYIEQAAAKMNQLVRSKGRDPDELDTDPNLEEPLTWVKMYIGLWAAYMATNIAGANGRTASRLRDDADAMERALKSYRWQSLPSMEHHENADRVDANPNNPSGRLV